MAASPRFDRVYAGCTRDHQARALIILIITVQIKSCVIHLDRWIAIQGAQIKAFLKRISSDQSGASKEDLTATTYSYRFELMRLISAVDAD